MHLLHSIFEWSELIIDTTAALIMVLGFVVATFSYFRITFRKNNGTHIMQMQLVRCGLGVKLVFALELLIISDLLHSLVSRSLDDMAIVGALVLIRTVISYFLNKEILEVSNKMSESHEADLG
jgi:uncharacterized membrane protein